MKQYDVDLIITVADRNLQSARTTVIRRTMPDVEIGDVEHYMNMILKDGIYVDEVPLQDSICVDEFPLPDREPPNVFTRGFYPPGRILHVEQQYRRTEKTRGETQW